MTAASTSLACHFVAARGIVELVQGQIEGPALGPCLGGRYILERVLGGGAMGSVFEASEPSGARFALKTLLARSSGPSARNAGDIEERRARFQREAALCTTIRHPHVIPVLDHGIDDATGVPYLVMPLLDGQDLAAVLDRVGRLEPNVAVALAVQACDGLAAAHALGIVHRDVKPSNLYLENVGGNVIVKVADFGLAKAYDAASDPGPLTATGRFMGTPQYVSPEQAVSAKHVDVRSDVFSLAMSLYHALAGSPAFAYVRSFMGLVLEITSREAPPVQDSAPWVSPAIAQIVHAALLREPAARCPTMVELALALDTAVGIDASRAAVSRESLRPPSDATRQKVAPRAESVSTWDDSASKVSIVGPLLMRVAQVLGAAALVLAPSVAPAAPPPAPPMGDFRVADQTQTTALPDGVVVMFGSNTAARWEGEGKLASETAKWTHGFHIDLTEGEIDVTMPAAPRGERALLVSTHAGTLTAWRGRMHLTVHGDTTAACIYEGAVVVGSNKQSFAVNDPTALVLHKGSDPDKSRLLPGPPSWGAAPNGASSFAVVPEGSAATLGLAWAAQSGASSYRVQVATDPEMTRLLEEVAVGDPRFALPGPGPGVHYWARTRSVWPDGIVSGWSAPLALRVVHYRLPAGALVARDGVVVLPDGASLPLTDGDGVDVAYENVRPGPPQSAPPLYWMKATGPLHVADDAPLRVVHLRDATLGLEGRVLIARRQLRADIDLQPKLARARDPIDVRAVLWDPSGRVDASGENVTLTALVDLDPVPVAWQRTGNVWTGRIGPRNDTGPSVVRVTAKDGLGQEIGRAFIEMNTPSRPGR